MKNWEIVKAHEEGAQLEIRKKGDTEWAIKVESYNLFDFNDFEYRLKPEHETDWLKVAVDTPVLCWNYEGQEKHRRYFSYCREGKLYSFIDGGTSYTKKEVSEWNCMVLDTAAPSLINWIENTGVAPECDIVCVERNITVGDYAGTKQICKPDKPDWLDFKLDIQNVITRYFIIK